MFPCYTGHDFRHVHVSWSSLAPTGSLLSESAFLHALPITSWMPQLSTVGLTVLGMALPLFSYCELTDTKLFCT